MFGHYLKIFFSKRLKKDLTSYLNTFGRSTGCVRAIIIPMWIKLAEFCPRGINYNYSSARTRRLAHGQDGVEKSGGGAEV